MAHFFNFARMISFWLFLSIRNFISCRLSWNRCRVAFWSRFGCVLTTFWSLASVLVSVLISPGLVWIVHRTHPHPAAVASAEFLPELGPWVPRNASLVNYACRTGPTFWTRTRSLFYAVSRAWISEFSRTYVLKLRFGHVLEQKNAFGLRNRPRVESTIWKNTFAFQNERFTCCVLGSLIYIYM